MSTIYRAGSVAVARRLSDGLEAVGSRVTANGGRFSRVRCVMCALWGHDVGRVAAT